jgi:hypothetical protein
MWAPLVVLDQNDASRVYVLAVVAPRTVMGHDAG